MSKIDTKNREEFRIWDFFEFRLSNDDIQPKNIEIWKVPLVSAWKENNWIVSYISDNNAKLWDKNTITVDMFWKTFYQPNPYFAVSHGRVNILIPKFEISEYVCRFFVSLIEKVASDKYEFKEMCTWKKLSKDIIKIPVNSEWNPDREYMENYMKNLEEKCKTKLQNLIISRGGVVRLINTNLWKEFKVWDLFEIYTWWDMLIQKLTEWDYPLISHSAENNWIAKLINKQDKPLFDYHYTISLADRWNFKSFVQNSKFYVWTRVKALQLKEKYHKNISKESLLFLSSLIDRLSSLFDYRDNATSSLPNHSIKLPVDSEWNPNRDFMENYIKNIESKCKINFSNLKN